MDWSICSNGLFNNNNTNSSNIYKLFNNDRHSLLSIKIRRTNNLNFKAALSVIECIKYKIIVYFSFTFLLFLFFWYTASAFCAVYENTQGIYVTDSFTSFIMGLVYPFALYLAPTALRYLSLKAKEKRILKYYILWVIKYLFSNFEFINYLIKLL